MPFPRALHLSAFIAMITVAGLASSPAWAQTALEQQCGAAVQGKVAWDRAGTRQWAPGNVSKLCSNTTNPGATIACFEAQIRQHGEWSRGINACQTINEVVAPPRKEPPIHEVIAPPRKEAPIYEVIAPQRQATAGVTTAIVSNGIARYSFDPIPYQSIGGATDSFEWVGGEPFEQTLYNPLDGGVVLRYRQHYAMGRSDGCSGPTPGDWKEYFRPVCLAHDTHYDAPFSLAGFPSYQADGSTVGKDIVDFAFLKDMLLLNVQAERNGTLPSGIIRNVTDTAAYNWFRGVQDWGGFRGKPEGKEVLEKGGVVAVKNNAAYLLKLRVEWTTPNGLRKSEEVTNAGGRAAAIPLSADARNIVATAWAVGGNQIFRKTFANAGMYDFTVGGTTLSNSFDAGLKADLGNRIAVAAQPAVQVVTGQPIRASQRGIKFNNQAGYVAEMSVLYHVNKDIGGGVTVPMPVVLTTPKIPVGFTRPLIVPADAIASMPIIVTITGVATTRNPVFSTTVSPDFTGELCFKSWGTILDPQGAAAPCK
ncbi:hypothetical protein [Nevskia ramosa]|uniref:hypothetical protein n=1 Tax=Nevskia ramosa TaxID=64002 RepID=UPI002355EE4B|nr:hypothetical protein [Nevskia ramosa]